MTAQHWRERAIASESKLQGANAAAAASWQNGPQALRHWMEA